MKYRGASVYLNSVLVWSPTLVCLSMKGLFAPLCTDPLSDTGVVKCMELLLFSLGETRATASPWTATMPGFTMVCVTTAFNLQS